MIKFACSIRLLIVMLLVAGCGSQLDEVSSLSVSTPTILDSLNTCDGVQPKFFRPVSSPDRFILDPGNGSQRFKAVDLGTSESKRSCVVAVKFNVPSGFKAKFHLAASIGKVALKATDAAFTFQIRAGFSTNKPLREADLNTGPSLIDDQFIDKNHLNSGSVDVQVDQRDGNLDLAVTDCGQRNVWFHTTSSMQGKAGTADIDLDLIHANFDMIRCP